MLPLHHRTNRALRYRCGAFAQGLWRYGLWRGDVLKDGFSHKRKIRLDQMTPETCPVCGADVPSRARACPECGADEHTGWSEEAESVGNLGVSEDSFDYEEYVRREFEGEAAPDERRRRFWKLVGLILLGSFLVPVVYVIASALLSGNPR